VGERREAVIEAESDLEGWRQATTDNYVTVLVPDIGLEAGTLIDVDIIEHRDGRLHGKVAGSPLAAAGGS
jgi:hypothetical protein